VVPLSLARIDERAVIVMESDSRAARNIVERRVARLALGPTRKALMRNGSWVV
jgi:hypothetical protein